MGTAREIQIRTNTSWYAARLKCARFDLRTVKRFRWTYCLLFGLSTLHSVKVILKILREEDICQSFEGPTGKVGHGNEFVYRCHNTSTSQEVWTYSMSIRPLGYRLS